MGSLAEIIMSDMQVKKPHPQSHSVHGTQLSFSCGPGTREFGNKCVVSKSACGDGTFFDPENHVCKGVRDDCLQTLISAYEAYGRRCADWKFTPSLVCMGAESNDCAAKYVKYLECMSANDSCDFRGDSAVCGVQRKHMENSCRTRA